MTVCQHAACAVWLKAENIYVEDRPARFFQKTYHPTKTIMNQKINEGSAMLNAYDKLSSYMYKVIDSRVEAKSY